MDKVRVFLADWQVLFREGIHFTLSGEEDMEVIGEDTENEPALAFIEANSPQIAILNASHDKLSGIEVTRRINQNLPEVAMFLIMDSEDEEQRFSVLKCGASACLTKDTDPELMVNVIRSVAQGKKPISEDLMRAEIAARVVDAFEAFASLSELISSQLARLATQEIEMLRHFADGESKEQVAGALKTSEETITQKLESIRYKLVSNEQKLRLIETAQSSLPPISSLKLAAEYITKEEFTAFKESLKESFKSLREKSAQTAKEEEGRM